MKTKVGSRSERSGELIHHDAREIDEPPRPGSAPRAAISVVIPTLNEAKNLRHVLPYIPSEYEVVVVDGHSDDGTVDVARELRPDATVVQQTGRGKGNALLCGFLAAKGDIIVTLDADGSAAPGEIPLFVAALLAGADFAKGSRFLAGGGSTDLTRLRSAGNLFLGSVVNMLYGTRYSDLCYGYNAFWRRCLPFIPETAEGFEIETMMHIAIARAGLQVVEVASFEGQRQYGESHLRTFRDGFRILGVIFRHRLTRERPETTRERVSLLDPA